MPRHQPDLLLPRGVGRRPSPERGLAGDPDAGDGGGGDLTDRVAQSRVGRVEGIAQVGSRLTVIRVRTLVPDALAALAVSLVVACASVLVHSDVEAPVIDDWTYAWSVEHLLETGRLQVLDWSIHYPITQILWALPFARVLGFSFAALRVSTIVLAWIGLLAFFVALRLGGRDRITSVLGTCVLFFNPVFFVLVYSFMTDIPFVSVMNVAIACYLLWSRRPSTVTLGVAGFFAVVSFLIRQLGAVLPLTPVAALPLSKPTTRGAMARDVLVGTVLPLAMIGLAWWSIRRTLGLTSVYTSTGSLKFLFSGQALWPRSWPIYSAGMLHALLHLGMYVAPLALWALPRTSRKALMWSGAVLTALGVVAVWEASAFTRLLEAREILGLNELGASRSLIHGEAPLRRLPVWAMTAGVGVVLVSTLVLLAQFGAALRSTRIEARIVAVTTLFQFGAAMALWLYYDRYYLPLLPGAIWLLVNVIDGMRGSRGVLAAVCLVSAVIAVTGTIDAFRFHVAVVAARDSLVRQGVPAAEIDAGYPLNGWWLYAHPENLPPSWRPESDVSFVTTSRRLPYVIANSPRPGYSVIRVITWSPLWAAADRVYVLRDRGDAPGARRTSGSG
jgi:hypothetical protein